MAVYQLLICFQLEYAFHWGIWDMLYRHWTAMELGHLKQPDATSSWGHQFQEEASWGPGHTRHQHRSCGDRPPPASISDPATLRQVCALLTSEQTVQNNKDNDK